MAAKFEPMLSMSAQRAPYTTASAPSMADNLPDINFGFQDLRARMADFTQRFDIFIADGRKRVLDERNRFRLKVTGLEEDTKIKQRSIDDLAQRSSSHQQNLAKEAAETSEMNEAVANIASQRDEREAERDRLRAEIAATQKAIGQRVEAQKAHAAQLNAQARFNSPELDFWMDYLCLRIEGAGKVDRLKFVFTHVDERDWEREAYFELNTESRDYSIKHYKPKVEAERMEACVEKLNENRDLGAFLKAIRELFVEALKTS